MNEFKLKIKFANQPCNLCDVKVGIKILHRAVE